MEYYAHIGKNGVPGTVRELVEDAEAIEQMFVSLSCELDKLKKEA